MLFCHNEENIAIKHHKIRGSGIRLPQITHSLFFLKHGLINQKYEYQTAVLGAVNVPLKGLILAHS